jgi:hypothetical protein
MALADLEPREAVAVELAVLRNLWKHVGRTDPIAAVEIAEIEARGRQVCRQEPGARADDTKPG